MVGSRPEPTDCRADFPLLSNGLAVYLRHWMQPMVVCSQPEKWSINMTAIAFARNVDFDNLDRHIARAKENRIRNIFTVEVLRPGSWQWEEVGETGALRTYADAEAIARGWVSHQTRARINVRPNTRVSITVAEAFAA